jgi:EndoU nuclease-like protein
MAGIWWPKAWSKVSGEVPKRAALFETLLCLIFFICACFPLQASEWSDTNPQINLTHIFDGEINRRGKPVGFHVRLSNRNPPLSRLKEIISGPNRYGVYTGIVEIFDKKNSAWEEKFSSFFPASLTKSEIINLIIKTWQKGKVTGQSKWGAMSSLDFVIEGYTTSRGGIITAYPIYVETK